MQVGDVGEHGPPLRLADALYLGFETIYHLCLLFRVTDGDQVEGLLLVGEIQRLFDLGVVKGPDHDAA